MPRLAVPRLMQREWLLLGVGVGVGLLLFKLTRAALAKAWQLANDVTLHGALRLVSAGRRAAPWTCIQLAVQPACLVSLTSP